MYTLVDVRPSWPGPFCRPCVCDCSCLCWCPIPHFEKTIGDQNIYTAAAGISTSAVVLYTGYGKVDYKNHALHILDHTQSPLSCGILKLRQGSRSSMRLFATMIGL